MQAADLRPLRSAGAAWIGLLPHPRKLQDPPDDTSQPGLGSTDPQSSLVLPGGAMYAAVLPDNRTPLTSSRAPACLQDAEQSVKNAVTTAIDADGTLTIGTSEVRCAVDV